MIETTSGQTAQTFVGASGSYYGWSTAIGQDFYAVGAWGTNKAYADDRQTNAAEFMISSSGSFGNSLAAQGDDLLVAAPRVRTAPRPGRCGRSSDTTGSASLLNEFRSPDLNDVNFGLVRRRAGRGHRSSVRCTPRGAVRPISSTAMTTRCWRPSTIPPPPRSPASAGRSRSAGTTLLIGVPGDGSGANPPRLGLRFSRQ